MELVVKHFRELSNAELYEILRVRVAVFVVEQHCPYQEIDEKDQNAYHVWYQDEDGVAAYLRVLGQGVSFPEAALGRVLTTRRSCGLGSRILSAGIQVAKEKLHADSLRIEAQLYAKGFYEKAGFRQVSEMFLEDGIPHIEMLARFS